MTYIPSNRLPAAGWSGVVGIPGGIPSTYSDWCDICTGVPGYTGYLASGNGINDDSIILGYAVQNCPNNMSVYIPSGSYLLLNQIQRFGTNPGGQNPFSLIIRGDGPLATRIFYSGTFGNCFQFSPINAMGARTAAIDSGNVRGSTTLYLSTGTNNLSPFLSTGIYIALQHTNTSAGAQENISNEGYMYDNCSQMIKVINVSGPNENVLTVYPAINEGYFDDTVALAISGPFRCGIQDLYIKRLYDGPGDNIYMEYAQECWIRNVESDTVYNGHIQMRYAANCEISHCKLHDTFSNGAGGNSDYGVWLFQWCSQNLVTDNIAYYCRHSYLMEWGGQGNVFSYNYSYNPINENLLTTDYLMGDLTTHGGNPRWNLFEGNVGATIRCDCELGGSDYDTFFRNYVTRNGIPTTYIACFGSDLQQWAYYHNLVGNVYGIPPAAFTERPDGTLRRWGSLQDGENIGPVSAASNTNPVQITYTPLQSSFTVANGTYLAITGILGNLAANSTGTYAIFIDNNNFYLSGVSGNGTYLGGGEINSAIDPHVQGTVYLDGEYEIASGFATWNTGNPLHVIPISYYLGSVPSGWDSNAPWPAIGPDIAYVNGGNPAYWRTVGQPSYAARVGSHIKLVGRKLVYS